MPNVSEFNFDRQTGKVYVEYDNGVNVTKDLSQAITGVYNTTTGQTVLDDASRAALNASGFPRAGNGAVIDGSAHGLIPDTGADLTANFQAAVTAGRIANSPVSLLPGKYVYSGAVDYGGGGLVCYSGIAIIESQSPTYSNHSFKFRSTDGSYLNGIDIMGIQFTCSTRPDSNLTNDAPEGAGFVLITKARNVRVWGNKFQHNWGGGVLFRDVQD